MIIDRFIDPYTKYPLHRMDNGDLFLQQGEKRIVYKNHNGIVDFTHSGPEKEYYDNVYSGLMGEKIDPVDIYQKWHNDRFPENLILLESLGNLKNKKILLLGNGLSSKELYFIQLGANIVYTDISLHAVALMRHRLFISELKERGSNNIEFHAVNALCLPFPNDAFDVIYGYSFVHHIENLDQFFSEVYRCLKKGGICRFLDGAYSPIWQFAKATFLRPLQLYTHKKIGLSPEDLRVTERGGYREDELIELKHKFEFTKLLFRRISFFQHLFTRGVGKLLGYEHYLIRKEAPFVMFLKRLDDYLARKSQLMQKNLLKLVWGFDK